MGNRLAFIFLLLCLSNIIHAQNITPERCKQLSGRVINSYCYDDKGPIVDVNGSEDGPVIIESSPSTLNTTLTPRKLEEIPVRPESLSSQCGPDAKPEVRDNGAGSVYTICRCIYPDAETNYYPYYPAVDANDNLTFCPKQKESLTSQSQQSSCLTALDQLEKDIERYAAEAKNTVDTCDTKSKKNESIQRDISGAAQATSVMLQNSAVNSGSVDKCRQAGLLSNAAGYGVGMINTNCKTEYNSCNQKKQSFDSKGFAQLQRYELESTIVAYCKLKGGGISGLVMSDDGFSVDVDPAVANSQSTYNEFIKRIEQISEKVATANQQCSDNEGAEENKTAGSLLKGTTAALGSYINASQQAAACEQALANTQSFVPLTMSCALGGGVNCPVNCVTNPSDPKCKSVSSTGGSQMAGGANKLGTSSLAGLNTASGSSTGASGRSGLDLSHLKEGSGSTGEAQKLEASGAMFGSAGAASAGGVGGTAAASTNAAGAEVSDEGSSQGGGIGGAFKALRSAAGNLFNGSGLFGSRTNSHKKALSNNLVNKGNNSLIRGLANANRNSCFIDSKGQSFCFGPKHKSIFDIMSNQYANQTPSLLRD